ncbi:MAG: amidohydrolase family protein [Pirellulaceae bacterium]|nr:amidohydrolase family protein [Pirellulaceae bacterium]
MTILTGQLLLCDRPREARLAPGYVRVDGGHIVEVVEDRIAKSADFGDANTLISPGFIDAHLHLPQFDMIGAHGMPLLQWLNDVTFPAEHRWAQTDFAQSMTQRVLRQCLSVGTTSLCAYATVHHDATTASLKLASEMGMRGVIGQVLMDRNAPDYLCRESAQLIDESAQTLDRFPPGSRMSAAVTPRFAVSCTENLLVDAGKLANEREAVLQTHLAETERECSLVAELFGGADYVDVYQRTGLMNRRSILGHGIHLSAADRQSISQSGAAIAHCPTANTFLQSGTMNREAILGDGVRLAVGSDIGAGYERSMVRVARSMIQSAASLGEHFPSPAQAWYDITAGNASALNWTDAGQLRAGDPADLVLIQPDIPWLTSNVPPLAMLMFAWDDRWIKRTMLRGQ